MRHLFVAAALLASSAAFFAPSDAEACGGCFAPPDNPTVVTDHRMILSISKDQTTLYDQIRYQGDPAAFAWVLPIRGTVKVGLSSDLLFGTLDQITRTQVQAPPRNCPPLNCNRGAFASSDNAGGADAGIGGVVVNKQEVVGPYETVQLSATDPTALKTWLATNGFSLPKEIEPVVAEYVNEKFDFLALKLIPGASVAAMRPVRITTPGAAAALPLRMVAAGTGATVGISLWVVGEGRYEPQNFPTFRIQDSELVYDWSTQRSNYAELRAAKTAASQGRAWELESSIAVNSYQVKSIVENGGYQYGGSQQADKDYLPVDGPNPKTAEQVRTEDLETLFHGIAPGDARITRVRADLAHDALDKDLGFAAPSDQSVLTNFRIAGSATNQPACPTCGPGQDANGNPIGYGICSVSGQTFGANDVGFGALALLGFVGFGVLRRRRR
jgi:MYXO-CTERM domain-containing protein